MNAVAAAEASGALDAMLSAEMPPLTLDAVLALEAMAQVEGQLGLNSTMPSAEMQLSLAAGALNIAAPSLTAAGAAAATAVAPAGGLPMAPRNQSVDLSGIGDRSVHTRRRCQRSGLD